MRGVGSVYNTLTKDYGFDTIVDKEKGNDGRVLTDKSIAPMALGQLTRGVTLRKLTEAYTVFPNYGSKTTSRSYLYVTNKEGDIVLKNDIVKKRVFSDDTGKIMNQLLAEVVKSGTAKAVSINSDIPIAGKTGTSGGNKDKVFIGYTPGIVAGIWCGRDDGKSIGQTHASHLEIWSNVISEIENECYYDIEKSFDTEGLTYAPYCMDSGKQYSQNCLYDPRGCRVEYGYFKACDKSYMEKCDTHVIVNYDTENKGVALYIDPGKEYARVSLVKNENRSFPKEIYITDAEYVYRDVNLKSLINRDSNLPYFYGNLKDGEYVGISNKKKQFNRLTMPQ